MRNKIFTLLSVCIIACTTHQSSFAQFGKLKDAATKAKNQVLGEDVGNIGLGLKEALENGVGSAVDQLSAKDGYLGSIYKIAVPEDAQKIIKTVEKLPGFDNVEETLIQKMNEAAELAAKEATPIFVDAIKSLTFKDAKAILTGDDNAATQYLSRQTRQKLYDAFLPVIQNSLDKVNARTYWTSVVNAYNKVPLVKKLNPELDDHVNDKALDGMFGLIEVKEKGIRTDVSQRTSPLLKEVFAQQ